MRSLTIKVLDIFVYRYEKKFLKGNFNDCFNEEAKMGQKSFERALSLIYEDVRLI